MLETLHDYMHSKNNVWGITARNREQNFAFNILLNPDIDIVTLVGQAGTGKTLLALAAGLAQVLETKRYNEVIVTVSPSRWAKTSVSCQAPKKKRCHPGWVRWTTTSKSSPNPNKVKAVNGAVRQHRNSSVPAFRSNR